MSERWRPVFIFLTEAAEWRKAGLSSQAMATESLDLTLDKVNTWAHTHTRKHAYILVGLPHPPPCPSAGDHTPRPHRVWEQLESLSRNRAYELSLWPPPSLCQHWFWLSLDIQNKVSLFRKRCKMKWMESQTPGFDGKEFSRNQETSISHLMSMNPIRYIT